MISFSSNSAGSFWNIKVLPWKENPFCHSSRPGTHAGLELMPCDGVSFGKFLHSVFHCLTCHQHSSFFFLKHINSTISCSNSSKRSCSGPMKDFWVDFAFISFCFCCVCLHTFASITLHWKHSFSWHSQSPLVWIWHHNFTWSHLKASCTCSFLLYTVCCFATKMNDLQCLQIRTKNATACCVLSLDYIRQFGNTGLGLARCSLAQCFILKFKATQSFKRWT